VAAPFPGGSTRVGPGPDRLAPPSLERRPLRVALLGCGTVGGGVLTRLLARPSLFRVTGVAVRELGRVRAPAVPRRLLTDDPAALLERDSDVVVELLGGREPARGLISWALHLGRHVVTANKALLAGEVDSLVERADRRGGSLRFSASVGGALPALEAVRRAAASGPVRSIAGVLNGTCNFVLDRLAEGSTYGKALKLARDAGYAEADPALDVDGSDSAQKLSLLAREAFGEALPWQRISRRGIDGLDERAVAEAARRGRRVRLVASCERAAEGLRASVQPLELPPDHPLARPRGAGNALAIELASGEVVTLEARGAGRWPTTEAVMADLHDLAAESVQAVEEPAEQEGAA
jgi:homoserine dehydrogenase